MKVTTSKSGSASAQARFAEAIRSRARETELVSIGYQSNEFDTKVLWLQDLGFWAYFGFPPSEKSPGERYWNVFGLNMPSGSVSIGCEINPPVSGTNRQAAGVFLEDPSGLAHIGHRGILNARGRIEKQFVFSNFRGEKVIVDDAGQRSQVLYVGRLADPRFPESLRDFIREVVRVKELARSKRAS